MDRHSRRLSHQKGSGIKTQANPPLSTEGNDGDLVMVGTTLYIKSQGSWMPFQSGAGNIIDGWHGSQTKIRVMPSNFGSGNIAGKGDLAIQHPFGYVGFNNSGLSVGQGGGGSSSNAQGSLGEHGGIYIRSYK